MRRCSNCKIEKDEKNFSQDKSRGNGRRYTCRTCVNEWRRIYYWKDVEKSRAKARENQNTPERRKYLSEHRLKVRVEVLKHYSGGDIHCACCGEKEVKFMTIDHTNNNGAEHRKEVKKYGGTPFYFWLRYNDFPIGFQVLCYNCNIAKYIFKKCPHNKMNL